MAEHYIEEYLISLGFDLNSDQAKEYISTCSDLEKKQKDLEKSGQSVSEQAKKTADAQQTIINGNKQEAESSDAVIKARSKLRNTPSTAPTVESKQTTQPVKETIIEPAKASKPASYTEPTPPKKQAVPKSSTPTTKPVVKNQKESKKQTSSVENLDKTVRQLSGAWDQLERGNIFGAFKQGSESIRSFNTYLSGLNTSINTANTKSGILKKTWSSMFGGSGAAEDIAGAGEAAAGAGESAGISFGVAAGAAGGIAAGVFMAAKGAYNMADGVAQAYTNVETMARQLWITDTAAYQLNNTLTSMGKTTADLNEIAINPILNQQFKTLQEFQKANLQLPSDFKATNEAFVEDFQTPIKETQMVAETAFQRIGYLAEKNLVGLFGGKLNNMADTVNDIIAGMLPTGLREQYIQSMYSTKQDTASTLAPNNYTTNSAQYEGAKVTYAPTFQITATSSDPNAIANAASQADQSAFEQSALTRNIQGPYR